MLNQAVARNCIQQNCVQRESRPRNCIQRNSVQFKITFTGTASNAKEQGLEFHPIQKYIHWKRIQYTECVIASYQSLPPIYAPMHNAPICIGAYAYAPIHMLHLFMSWGGCTSNNTDGHWRQLASTSRGKIWNLKYSNIVFVIIKELSEKKN